MPNHLALLVALTVSPGIVLAQADSPKRGEVTRIKVHGRSLEGNLEGDSADRDVSVYLPPSYRGEPSRRYPVVYLLHGFTDTDELWFGFKPHFISIPAAMDKALASGTSREMILVMPNAYTAWAGSFYSRSPVTGDWESFVATDLVDFIDSHYRTIPDRRSRGLAGHSMGGYGTLRIGMKHPEVFSSIYALSSCCLSSATITGVRQVAALADMEKAEAIHSADDFARAPFLTKAPFALAAAWSPNPKNPPFFFDLPTKSGQLQSGVMAEWAANAPLSLAAQYSSNLKKINAIALDVGLQDDLRETNRLLDELMTQFGIPHTFQTYEGTHVSKIAERVETKTLPFFSRNLSFGPSRK